MDNEQEYITLTQVAEELGWNKATVYDWIKTLGIEKHRFVRNKNTYLHIADVERLKEIKAKPWLAGPNIARTARSSTEKAEKPPVSTPVETPREAKEKAPKRDYTTSEDIPDGWVLCSDFLEGLGLKETTFRRWLKDGLQGEQFEFEKRDKYRYFSPEQQEKAVELLKRYGKLTS
jgi:predicted site-specific integrase-resolvase